MGLFNFLNRAVTWWNNQTLGTQFYTWRKGVYVGEDELGNFYYQSRDKKRRWVIYNGLCEASKVSQNWHGWLHHTWDEPPVDAPLVHKPWEMAHTENQTGLETAYRPEGSQFRAKAKDRSDYEAWVPE